MNRITVFFLGVLTGAIGLFVSENYYIVRSKETVHVVPKIAAKLEIPYRDIREYTVEDWREDPSLALAIVKSKKENLLMESGLNDMQNQLQGLLNSLGGS
ncbi:MAG: hypothetical protein AAF394_18190 [Planctomycetota bacterium]